MSCPPSAIDTGDTRKATTVRIVLATLFKPPVIVWMSSSRQPIFIEVGNCDRGRAFSRNVFHSEDRHRPRKSLDLHEDTYGKQTQTKKPRTRCAQGFTTFPATEWLPTLGASNRCEKLLYSFFDPMGQGTNCNRTHHVASHYQAGR